VRYATMIADSMIQLPPSTTGDSTRGSMGTQESKTSPSRRTRTRRPVIIVDALAARTGGTAQAAVEVAHRLAEEPVDEIIVVARQGSVVASRIHQRSGLRLVELPWARPVELARRLVWQAIVLPKLTRREGAASVLTWSGMLPRDVDGRVVCYLGNSLMFVRGGATNAVRRWAVRRTVRRGADVLVPSRAMAELVEKLLGRRPEVVPLGVDHSRFQPATEPGTELLCVADFYRHKRHDLLLEAWTVLPSPRPRLRLIGDPRVDRSWYRELVARAARHHDLGEIIFEFDLSRDRLAEAYRAARVFAVASQQESFCLPLLEAQACGVPAVARDSPVLRETGGEGTAYVAGDDPGAWAEAIQRLFADDVGYSAARAAGLEHAQRFSWDKTAAAVRARLLPERSTE
jgi:glycosyltransferase involved in cell wall biosynthesis